MNESYINIRVTSRVFGCYLSISMWISQKHVCSRSNIDYVKITDQL